MPLCPLELQPEMMESRGGRFAVRRRTVLCVYIVNSVGRAALPALLRVLQAGGRRRWQSRAVPAIPQGRGPGRLGMGEGVGEGDAAGAGSQGRLCLLGARRRQGSQRCARLRRAAKCVRLPRLRRRLGAGTR